MNAFLTHLALDERVVASTQNRALAALLFVYRHVLARLLDRLDGVIRPRRLPTVLNRDEVRQVLQAVDGTPQLVLSLQYGVGLRVLEGLQLRV